MGFLDRLVGTITGSIERKASYGLANKVHDVMKGPDPWKKINVDEYYKKIKITKENDGSYSFSVEDEYIGSISASVVEQIKKYSRIKAGGELKRYLEGMKYKGIPIFKNDELRKKVTEKFLDMIGIK